MHLLVNALANISNIFIHLLILVKNTVVHYCYSQHYEQVQKNCLEKCYTKCLNEIELWIINAVVVVLYVYVN